MAGPFTPSLNHSEIRRQSNTRRNSKFSRLSQLRTDTAGVTPRTVEVPVSLGMNGNGSSDWSPVRLVHPERSDSISIASPQSCITDAFSGDTAWSMIRDSTLEASVYRRSNSKEEDPELTYQSSSCTTETFDEDCLTRKTEASEWETETATSWDGVTIIDDSKEHELIQPGIRDYSYEDYGKEVAFSPILPLVHCRIDSVIMLHGFPEFMPVEEENEKEDPDDKFARQCRFRRTTFTKEQRSRSLETHPVKPPPPFAERKGLDPMSISREVMAQEWTETPPMRLDMAKLESTASQRVQTPSTINKGMNTSSVLVPWLNPHSRSVSPRPTTVASIEGRRKSPDLMKRSRNPHKWKLWR